MPAASRSPNYVKTETDIAVLQVQVSNIEYKVSELKEDIKAISQTQREMAEDTKTMLAAMRDDASRAHGELNKKIGALEKWRWMMMGAGIVIGSLGFEALGKLLK